jgi:5-methylcytosine-specific restriction protein A
MPSLAKRPCTSPGCPELVASGRCPRHAQAYDRARGTTAERGYANGWQRVRSAKLVANPFCQIRTHCHGAMATEVDHIIPIDQRPELRLEPSNLQSSCKACNVAKRNELSPKQARFPRGGSASRAGNGAALDLRAEARR